MDEKFTIPEEDREIFSYDEELEHIDDDMTELTEQEELVSPPSHSSVMSLAYDWLKAMIISVMTVVLLLTFVFRLVTIDGSSMENTLYGNENNADKAILTTFNYKPHNGDIVAISHGGNLNETIIKRVIATEGQTLKIDYEKAQVIVDGVILDEPYIKDPTTQPANWDVPEVIPEGYVFVMGDNREVSLDSRNSRVGLIPVDDIIGKAQIVIAPFNRIQYLY